jgi:hypothetical protein
VSALALADGRCVSLGVTGSIWVWDLESGTGAEVIRVPDLDLDVNGDPEAVERKRKFEGDDVLFDQWRPVKGTVVFDERRILSAGARGAVVRRFDI